MGDHVLVMGAGGFVGQHLVRILSARGEKVIAVSRRPTSGGMRGVEHIVAELTEPAQFSRLLDRCRTVVHLASCSTPGNSAGRPVDEIRGNLLPLSALLQAMQLTPQVELLYLSSGGSLYATASGDPATEASHIQPRSYHGAAKAAAEHFITAWSQQYCARATLLRPSNIYGPGQIERTDFGIVPACFGKIVRDETLPVWGDGSTVRDYLYIDDFISLCLAILSAPMSLGVQVFNASSGIGVSLNELFCAIEMVTGKPLHRSYELHRAVDARHIVMDAGIARNRYEWAPSTSLEEGLRRTWAWFNSTQQ
jgi:UDP-glucose 4-epimerase